MEWMKRFCGWIYHFSSSLTLVVLQRQKCLPDIGGTTIQDVGHLAVMRAAMEPGVHTMSDELILQISCNIFLAFKLILMMTSGQNISHYTTAKLSVHVWNHDLLWWQNKIDTQKHFHKTTITGSWALCKTKMPITIAKAQMPSNPNQYSRTRDNGLMSEISCYNWISTRTPIGPHLSGPLWRRVMETLSALPALCEGNHRSPVVSPHNGTITRTSMLSLIIE